LSEQARGGLPFAVLFLAKGGTLLVVYLF